MPLEEFIITVFGWVETVFADVTAGVKLRTRGCTPRLSDSEVITLEIVGELLGHDGDEAIWTYFKRHGAAWFPGLGDRSASCGKPPICGESNKCCMSAWRRRWVPAPPPAISSMGSPLRSVSGCVQCTARF